MPQLNTALERALPIVAAAYGEKFGVNVILSGDDAYTNGQDIVLPLLDNMSELSNVLFGYLAHEAAHIRDSDFDIFPRCNSGVEKSLLNIIEDIRIEQLMQDEFPGTQFTLTDMWNYIVEQDMSPPARPDDNEATQLLQYMLHRLRSQVLKREASDNLFTQSQSVVEQTFPVGFFIRLDGLIDKYMPTLSDSSDCLRLARAILKSLEEAEQEERENSEDSGQSDDSTSQDGQSDGQNGQGSPDGDSSSDDANQDGSSSSPTTDDSSSSDADDDAGNSPNSPDSSDDQDTSSSDGASMHERLVQESDLPEDAVSSLRDSLVDQAVQDAQGSPVQIDTSTVGQESGANGDSSRLNAGILASSSVRSRLLGLLAAKTREQHRLHTRGKRIDGKRLTRLANGDSRVFIQRDEKQDVETSVHLLLDCSGSMTRNQQIANQATVSLALAVSAIPKCDIAVSMFPGDGGDVSPMLRRGQPVRAVLNRFDVSSRGGTPLAQAMLYAARDLASSKRPRKVLIIVTDGDPSNPGAVQYMNKLLEGYVDTYAIGIASTAVQRFFDNWSVIHDVSELQQALFAIAGKFLDLN